jgi:hypothetical protein
MERVNRAKVFIDDSYLLLGSAFNKAKNMAQTMKGQKSFKRRSKRVGRLYKENAKRERRGRNFLSLEMERVQLIDKSIMQLSRIQAPKVWVPVEEFAMNKSADTFANVALESYAMAKKLEKTLQEFALRICFLEWLLRRREYEQ